MVNWEFIILLGRSCSGKTLLSHELKKFYDENQKQVLEIDFDFLENKIVKDKLKSNSLLNIIEKYKKQDYKYEYNKKNFDLSRKIIYEFIEMLIYDHEKIFDLGKYKKDIVIILDDYFILNSEREKYLKILVKNFIYFTFIFLDIPKEICIDRSLKSKLKRKPMELIKNTEFNFNNFYKKEFYIRFKSNQEYKNIKLIDNKFKEIKKKETSYFEKIKNKLIILERNKTLNEEVSKYFNPDIKSKNKTDKKVNPKDRKLNTVQNLKDIELRNYINEINDIMLEKSNLIPNSSDVHMLINFLKKLNMNNKVIYKVLMEKKKEFLKLDDTKKVSNINDLRSKFTLFIINL